MVEIGITVVEKVKANFLIYCNTLYAYAVAVTAIKWTTKSSKTR